MAFHFSPKIVTDGLVLYLDASNTKSYVSGSSNWVDLSLSGVNSTLTNGFTFSSENYGNILFNGSSYGSMGSIDISNVFTVNSWAKLSATSGSTFSIVFGSGANQYDNFLGFKAIPGIKGSLYVTESANVNNYQLLTSSSLELNRWYYLTFIVNVSYIAVYVNGLLSSSATVPFVIGSWSSNLMTIGVRSNLTQYFLNGGISNLQIYKRVLTDSEIKQNFNATKSRFGL